MSKTEKNTSKNKLCEQLKVQNITLYKLLYRIEKEHNEKIKNISNKLNKNEKN